jgi:hypothetical protein
MDSRTQSIWLRFGPISSSPSSSSLTMGAFTLCGVYSTWLDHNGHVFTVPEAMERLEALNSQISSAAKKYARMVVHGDLNLDLDRSKDVHYVRKSLLKSLAECTKAAGLKTHSTPPTWHSYGLHRGSGLQGGEDRLDNGRGQLGNRRVQLGEGGSQPGNGCGQPGEGSAQPGNRVGQIDDGDACYSYVACLDNVYTEGFPDATSKVLEDKTTDHHPVLTTIKSGGGQKHLIKLKGRHFKAIRRGALEAALSQHDWTGIYSIKDLEEIHKFVVDGIIAALNVVAPVKEIVVKTASNLYLSRETLEMIKRRDLAKPGTPRFCVLRNATNRLVKRDKLTSNAETLAKSSKESYGSWPTTRLARPRHHSHRRSSTGRGV